MFLTSGLLSRSHLSFLLSCALLAHSRVMDDLPSNDVDKSVGDVDSANAEETVTPPAPREEIIGGQLSPRHRRFAQLVALQTLTLKELSAQTGFSYEWCKALTKDPVILKEIHRFQDKVFEESVKEGLKTMKQSALDHLRFIMDDDTGRVKNPEKTAVAQWVIEKLDGKATQTNDIGENTLALFMDQLERMKNVPRGTAIDVTPNAPRLGVSPDSPPENETKPRTEEDALTDWVADYVSES